MKQIIALWHSANKGKTETLIELGNLLLSEITIDDIVCGKSVNEDKRLPKGKDFRLISNLKYLLSCFIK